MHQEIEAAELALRAGHEICDLRVVRHIAGQDQGLCQLARELAHVLLEALALIGHREPRASRRGRLRNRPRDGSLVGDANNQPELTGQLTHIASGMLRRTRQAWTALPGTRYYEAPGGHTPAPVDAHVRRFTKDGCA